MSGTQVPEDEGQLIRLCREGDQSAFDSLVSRHYRGIYNMTYRMLGNAEDASDLTQETFLRAYTRLETFQLGRPFTAWIRRIATNLCIDHLRQRGQPTLSLEERLESGVEEADSRPEGSPVERMEMAEDSQRVLAAVQRLPAKQRAVLVMRHIEGMTLEEIAAALRWPLGTVKVNLFRGRQAVREMVGEL
jgi:RNA polymerase sigma-70 factor (ECF subfamily)